MTEANNRRGCRGTARVLMVLILATALFGLGLSIYTFVNRPTTGTLTPAGANYNPGQPGAATSSGAQQKR